MSGCDNRQCLLGRSAIMGNAKEWLSLMSFLQTIDFLPPPFSPNQVWWVSCRFSWTNPHTMLRSGVADYVIFLITLYDISFCDYHTPLIVTKMCLLNTTVFLNHWICQFFLIPPKFQFTIQLWPHMPSIKDMWSSCPCSTLLHNCPHVMKMPTC